MTSGMHPAWEGDDRLGDNNGFLMVLQGHQTGKGSGKDGQKNQHRIQLFYLLQDYL